jgi:hypothetical protein
MQSTGQLTRCFGVIVLKSLKLPVLTQVGAIYDRDALRRLATLRYDSGLFVLKMRSVNAIRCEAG